MKKIFIAMTLLLSLVLVACTENTKLPDLKNEDKVELTLEEKYDLLKNTDLSIDSKSGVGATETAKLSFDFESESRYSYEKDTSSTTFSKGSLKADVKTKAYATLGNNVEEALLYTEVEHAKLEVKSESDYKAVYKEPNRNTESSTKHELNIDFKNSFLMIFERLPYLQTNGTFKYLSEEDGVVIQNKNEKFDNLKETTDSNDKLPNDTYLQLKNSIESLKESMNVLPNDMPETEAEVTKFLEEFDKMVSVYKKDNVYTVQISVTKTLIDPLIDQAFKLSIEQLSPADTESLENINKVKEAIKASFKSLNIDFRLIIQDQKLSKIQLEISGEVKGFEFETNSQDNYYGYQSSSKVKFNGIIESLGFELDFNATEPKLPTKEELKTFKVVETPAIFDLN